MLKPKVQGLLLTAAAMLLLGASSAQGQTIQPPGESFTAQSTDSILEYDGEFVECDLSTASGETSNPASDTAALDSLIFGPPGGGDNCIASLGDVLDITTEFPPDWELVATSALGGGDGEGHVQIPSGGSAEVVVGLFGVPFCTIRVDGAQQVPASFEATPQELTVGVSRPGSPTANNVQVTASGGLCPLASSGPGRFSATYEVSSANPLSIQP